MKDKKLKLVIQRYASFPRWYISTPDGISYGRFNHYKDAKKSALRCAYAKNIKTTDWAI